MISQLAQIIASLLFGLALMLLTLELLRRTRSEKPVTARVKSSASRISAWLAPRLPEEFRKRTEKQIAMAGGLNQLTPEMIVLGMIIFGALGIVLGVLAVTAGVSPGLALIMPIAGLILPITFLRDAVKRRHNEILRQLPFHLDLLTLGVEAGLDFTQALSKMVEKGKPGALREEFNLTLSRIRVGVARSNALRELADRVDLPPLTSFVGSLIQADKLGMSIGKVLRIQSDTVRQDRSQRAEKRANEAPVKILIPLVLFIFPTIWIILFAPLVFSMTFAP